jgi:PKD repeat protein
VTEQNCQAGAGAHCFTGQTTARILVEDSPPVASFNAPASVTIGQPANFDASASADSDGFITGYHWAFGDGQSQDTAGPTTSHTYGSAGSETVTLTVTDDDGSISTTDQTVSVIDQPPTASFTVPAGVAKGQAARLDASGSSDPDDAITSYRWDFGDGKTQSTTAPVTTHTYSQAGRKAVTLTVSDSGGNSDSVQHTVTVTAGLAIASFTGPATVGLGHSAAFDASGSWDPNGTITSYRWDFGDGQTSTTSTPTASHTYAIAGPVTVTLTITDDSGGIAVVQRALNVLAAACVVPKLFGRKLGAARRILSASGCQLGAVKHRRTRAGQRRRVIRQSIRPEAIRPAGQAVTVTIGK